MPVKRNAARPGKPVETVSGRQTKPFPVVPRKVSDRSLTLYVKRICHWLHSEALIEAEGNDYVTGLLNQMNPDKLSPSDHDVLHTILFEEV